MNACLQVAVHLRDIEEGADEFNQAWLEVMDAEHLPVRRRCHEGCPCWTIPTHAAQLSWQLIALLRSSICALKASL